MKNILKKTFILIAVLSINITLFACNKTSGTTIDSTIESKISQYADSSYIVGPEWLKDNLDNVLILDARGEKSYSKGHIPGAISVTWQQFSNMNGAPGDKGWGTVLEAEKLSEKLSALGITNETQVVVYADTNAWGEDGRIVWMLRMAGVNKSAILDGGWNYWENNGFDTTSEIIEPTPSKYTISEIKMNSNIKTDELSNSINDIKIIDTRSKEEYEGAVKYGEARGGYIPTSIHLPFNELLKSNGTLKNKEELEKIFNSHGLMSDDIIVTYCTAGIRSAHMQVVFSIMGYEKAMNYDESFYTWAADDSLEVIK